MSSAIKQQLAAIEARAEKATPGPWWNYEGAGVYSKGQEGLRLEACEDCGAEMDCDNLEADTDFMAHARTDIPRLVAALKCAVEGLEKMPKFDEVRGNVTTYRFESGPSRLLAAIEKILTGEKNCPNCDDWTCPGCDE